MQAIILAAGMGKRLGELTKDNTKCMVKVNGVCLIDRLLSQLSELGLKRIILVIGYKVRSCANTLETNTIPLLSSIYITLCMIRQTISILSI